MATVPAPLNNNYVVGRGEAYFDAYAPNTTTLTGEQFFGDCNALAVTIKSTELDHYGSTGGIKVTDASVIVQADASGQLTTENISVNNLSLFFFGTSLAVTTAVGTVTAEVVPSVIQGAWYAIGKTAADPVGLRGLNSGTPVVVKDTTATTTYVLGTDYTFDYDLGRLYIVPGGSIASASSPKITYTTKVATRTRVISGTTPIEGAMRYIAYNANGLQRDYYMPQVRLTPNGSHDLIGDKFAMLQFDLKVLKNGNLPFLFIDGRAA